MDAAANPSHALALVLVDELARNGVTDAVLAPGSRSTALALALHDDPRIRLHVQVDERSAGFLAVGLARATGRPAPVVVTSGSAVANLHPAVVEADTGAVPLVLLTADRPPELRGTGANQAIDQLGVFGRGVRWFVEVGVPEDRPGVVGYWRATTCRALAEARGLSGPPGPVHVNLAFREPTVPLTDDGRTAAAGPFAGPLAGRSGRRPWLVVDRTPRHAPAAELEALAGRIAGTERGLVVVGQTAADAAPVLDLARRAGWPVIAEPTSNVRYGDQVVASAHLLLGHAGFAAAHRPEFVLRVGRTGLSRNLARLLGPDVPQLLLDPDGAWHDPERAVAELLVADVGLTAATLRDALAVSASSEWSERWRTADARVREVGDRVLDAEAAPSEPRVARDLAAGLPDGTTLVVASSMPIRDLDQFLAPREHLRVLANRGASGIDGFVSTALGVALAGTRPTVALTGDLSLLHDANGFLLAPDAQRIDLPIVVVDNDGGGIFSFLPQHRFPAAFERVFGTPHGRDLADLARLHRLGYTPVAAAADLVPAVDAARRAGGIGLVHVRTDRADNLALHRRLTAEVHAALDALA
ncbi:2-succinyl-5-enolpyruvyl-6-hydroxy-3-cyclohexene-1-carboxylic-acid synthase [Egicoccus halophilus]|uniref:2-succinyl-5-enolpyruvyl-6-hydroxy-3-cyclohexene-1-carboxylate synthase n=1 Tax=Egicoccus halophilus TaxID=1670830 RepID=A0A8J3EUE8_9ACTN|nr:2-succinyl-5-enolpyruvyl-6-hydroxy-3-cyclohexene-1-carboxylic-acid synthase [Egicoccus halophilus]GGI05705.1 2-succinyl-5-enolpyruvyl-6-hydroxy-3-cyclohexene-1-carboxylate synthase [Egicoccus halophilus]